MDPDPYKKFNTIFLCKISNTSKMTYAFYELILFMCVKQKCNLYFQKYYILVIFVEFYASFPWFLQFFATRIRIRIIDMDPGGQNDTDPAGSGSTSLGCIYVYSIYGS